jgi:glycosyltransferase involved in cell wall biosynthesis
VKGSQQAPKSLKIAFVIINANRREGTSRAVVEVAERLARRHDVSVISRTAESLDRSILRWIPVRAPRWPDVAEFEFFRIGAEKILRLESFDLIHSAGCNVAAADVYAIQTVHPKKMEINAKQNRNAKVGRLRQWSRAAYDRRVLKCETRAYRSLNKRGAVGFLPVSRGTEQELISAYDIREAIVEVIPNGADLEVFNSNGRLAHRSKMRSELRCEENDVVFLFAGGEWNRKGLALTLESFAIARHPNRILVIAGDDPERAHYRLMAEHYQIADRIRWIGFRTDIDRVFAAADVFLFLSAYEAFSLATIEASASGLPVVMCDISGATELLGDGLSGHIVPRDARHVAAVIDDLAADEPLRNTMGQQGRQKVERHFAWDHIANQTEEFYFRLLEHRQCKLNGDDRI